MFLAKKVYFAVLCVGLVCCSVVAHAGTNPISYSMTPSGGLPSSTSVGNSYSVNYTLTNNLPFAEPLGTVERIINGTGFTVTDQCSDKTLAASGGTCTVSVGFHPSDTGAHSLQLVAAYDKNRVLLPALSTMTTDSGSGSIAGATTEPLPSSTTVDTGYNIEFTFTNTSDTESVTASSITYTGNSDGLSNIVNDCSSAVSPGNSCHITATYTPIETGSQTVGATYNYDDDSRSVSATTHTVSSGGGGGCASVDGSTPLALPTSTYIYGDNVVEFKFTNHCDSASAALGTVALTATLGSSSLVRGSQQGRLNVEHNDWITKGEDTCSGQTLPAGQSCTVQASIVPEATGTNLNVNAQVSYSQSEQTKNAEAASASNIVQPNTTSARTITVINQCSFPVWITPVAAAAYKPAGESAPACNAEMEGCPTGTQCFTGGGLCYYSNPSVPNNGKLLGAEANQSPSTMDITIPEDNAGSTPPGNILYNAGIAARLGCTGSGSSLFCTENNCGGTVSPTENGTTSAGVCAPGVGPVSSPGMSFNAVEFTFLKNSNSGVTQDGVYDEQTINGVNVPMEMKGRGPESSGTAPYSNCQPTGAAIQKITGATNTQLGSCTYEYTPPSTTASGVAAPASNYRFVTPVGENFCEDSDSQCDGKEGVCGLAYHNFGGSTGYKLTKMCGNLQGYVSVNTAICSQDSAIFHDGMPDLQAQYRCNAWFPSDADQQYQGKNLYACSSPSGGTYTGASCYNPGSLTPEDSCCGCKNWWEGGTGITVPHGSGNPTTLCAAPYVNSHWTTGDGIVQPQIQWVKAACPTAYSYQYDDPSSSFQCTVTSSGNITTNYQVTLCPAGESLTSLEPAAGVS